MELTQEQINIVNTVHGTDPIIKINAYAGTGKTTTLVEVVKEIRNTDPKSRILYLVFNKMMAKEATSRFDGLNVQCFTAHAFALRRLRTLGEPVEVVTSGGFSSEFFNLKKEKPKFKYLVFKKFKLLMDTYTAVRYDLDDFIQYAQERGIGDTSFSDLDLEFFKTIYQNLLRQNKYTHGMYLKEYAINHHDKINDYDYVLLDEAQDLNPFMMDIISRINRKKLYVVGDNYQQIYSWNNAINSMQRYEGELYPLSKSFRFNKEIRDVAHAILSLQDSYRASEAKITNVHNKTKCDESKITILFRTNAAMLEKAINLVAYSKGKVKVHFMDMINGSETNGFNETFNEMLEFTKVLLEGIYGKDSGTYKEFVRNFPIEIRSKAIKEYEKIAKSEYYDSLYEYLLRNESILSLEYMRYWAIFKMLGRDITETFRKVQRAETITDFEKEYTLCTAHRAKGAEWPYVIIAEDNWKINDPDEINLLYVACTRAKNKLDYSSISNILEVIQEETGEYIGNEEEGEDKNERTSVFGRINKFIANFR